MANRKIDQLLSPPSRPSSVLGRLVGHAAQQDAWTDQLRALLPQELAFECRVANLRDRVLTVHINSAAWATRLRFLAPDVRQSLNRLADFAAVEEIRLKVVPLPNVSTEPQSLEAPRPPEPAPLTELAGRVDDAPLRDAILRLSARGRMPAAQPTGSAEHGPSE